MHLVTNIKSCNRGLPWFAIMNKTVCKTLTLAFLILSSCSSDLADRRHEYTRRCEALADECVGNCVDEAFSTCYIDKNLFPNGPYDMVSHCYATHVGQMCVPCHHIFSLSFGGSLRKISCEDFLAGLDNKNKQCGNCLVKYGKSPFSF